MAVNSARERLSANQLTSGALDRQMATHAVQLTAGQSEGEKR